MAPKLPNCDTYGAKPCSLDCQTVFDLISWGCGEIKIALRLWLLRPFSKILVLSCFGFVAS